MKHVLHSAWLPKIQNQCQLKVSSVALVAVLFLLTLRARSSAQNIKKQGWFVALVWCKIYCRIELA